MKLNREQWMSILNDIPNYDVADFSLARMHDVQTEIDDGEQALNVLRFIGMHIETGVEVDVVMRLPDHIVELLTQSLHAMNEHIKYG